MIVRKTVEADLAYIGEIYENAKRFMRESGNPNQWNAGTPNAQTAREDMERGTGYVVEENGDVSARKVVMSRSLMRRRATGTIIISLPTGPSATT